MTDKTAADLVDDAKLTTCERPGPGDGIPRAAIIGSCGLEQSQHPLRAVSSPRRDDPPIGFAQRLRRTHT
ncbi:MAG: hypothetical protein JOZ76_15885 [Bradyrhizobium sp.]|nr:hypothetical protein [Bradyrhizobium sp.]MBV8919547.1 hypothetical protein [Bradyrhizobium sp.]